MISVVVITCGAESIIEYLSTNLCLVCLQYNQDEDSGNLSFLKKRAHLSDLFNVAIAVDVATQGTKASIAMVLNLRIELEIRHDCFMEW